MIQSIDQSLFPIDLQTSECYLLHAMDSFHIIDYQHFFEHWYPLSLFDGFHCFSFWFFLTRESKLSIQIGNFNVQGRHVIIGADQKWNFKNGKRMLISDRWIHIFVAKVELRSNYRIWINGRHFSTFDWYETRNRQTMANHVSNHILLTCNLNDNPTRKLIRARMADLVAFKRCLSLIEIQAIYQQQTSIDRIKIGTYMKKKKNAQPED